MSLKSNLFAGDQKLESAALSNPAHIQKGAAGPHVGKIQRALIAIDGGEIAKDERSRSFFGASTEQAVLQFKTARNIVNKTYQNTADAIVGIMTMKALDDEMVALEDAVGEATMWCTIASALGYSPQQPRFVTNDEPLRSTVDILQKKR